MTKAQIRTAIIDRHGAGETRDQIIIALVTDGVTLNTATRSYQTVAKDEGWTAATTSHKAACLDELRARYDPSTWTPRAIADAVAEWTTELGIAESTARDYCKEYSKELGVPHPVRDPRTAIFEWFRDNEDLAEDIDAMKTAYLDFAVNELGRSRSNANEYWKGYELHLYLTK